MRPMSMGGGTVGLPSCHRAAGTRDVNSKEALTPIRLYAVRVDDVLMEAILQNLAAISGRETLVQNATLPDTGAEDGRAPSVDGVIVDSTDYNFVLGEVATRLGDRVPVIVISDRIDPHQEGVLLRNGIVDVVEKRRGLDVIAARIFNVVEFRTLVPPPAGADDGDAEVSLGALLLDFRRFACEWRSHRIHLTQREFRIVHLLVQRAGEYVTHRDIYDAVRPPGFQAGQGVDGFKQNVRASIKRIRGKFRAADPDFSGIEPMPGVGYRWQPEEIDPER